MEQNSADQRLSRINTLWTVVHQAAQGPAADASAARGQLLRRYGKAVHRYLLAAVHDPEAARDLAQDFAVRFLAGGFAQADAHRGRFRDFLKGVLSHLIADHYRQRPRHQPLPRDGRGAAIPAQAPHDPDAQFLDTWREQLLARTWEGLAQVQHETGRQYASVLLLRVTKPGLRSTQMAEQLTAELGRPLTADAVRQLLHRARDCFADLLLDEVRQTLQDPTRQELERELADLHLLDYCRPALERAGRPSHPS
jgi:RNA polymerase sigma-70 factor (ECF subfamily)